VHTGQFLALEPKCRFFPMPKIRSSEPIGSHGDFPVYADAAAVRIGLLVGLQYVRTRIDAYSENGDAVLTQFVNGQPAQALIGNAGARACSVCSGAIERKQLVVNGGLKFAF
jgi:hypothetical protein